ncbi:hypothetical protein [Allocoleopsis sp.]
MHKEFIKFSCAIAMQGGELNTSEVGALKRLRRIFWCNFRLART